MLFLSAYLVTMLIALRLILLIGLVGGVSDSEILPFSLIVALLVPTWFLWSSSIALKGKIIGAGSHSLADGGLNLKSFCIFYLALSVHIALICYLISDDNMIIYGLSSEKFTSWLIVSFISGVNGFLFSMPQLFVDVYQLYSIKSTYVKVVLWYQSFLAAIFVGEILVLLWSRRLKK